MGCYIGGESIKIVKIVVIGYVPADVTVHPPPPPQNYRGWVKFFSISV